MYSRNSNVGNFVISFGIREKLITTGASIIFYISVLGTGCRNGKNFSEIMCMYNRLLGIDGLFRIYGFLRIFGRFHLLSAFVAFAVTVTICVLTDVNGRLFIITARRERKAKTADKHQNQ